jgi:hypothetical protein
MEVRGSQRPGKAPSGGLPLASPVFRLPPKQRSVRLHVIPSQPTDLSFNVMTIRVAFFKSPSAALHLWILPRPVSKVERGSKRRTAPRGLLGTPPTGSFRLQATTAPQPLARLGAGGDRIGISRGLERRRF